MATTKGESPGKFNRKGIGLMELIEKYFPNEESAAAWFEQISWPDGRFCMKCGSHDTYACTHPTMPYRCRGCKKFFSVKTGTVLQGSRISLRKWVIAIYLNLTSLKGVSSMKLHRDLGVTQKTAWFMLQRIREAFMEVELPVFVGPVEADESYFGGKEKNKHASKKLNAGRGTVGKTAVAGIKDRETGKIVAKVVERVDKATLQGFVKGHIEEDATVYTDEAKAYQGFPNHKSVNHGVGEYVNGMAHTNGMEGFWSTLKRAYHGTYHKISPKHLNRYVAQFAGSHNIRELDTIEQLQHIVAGFTGKRLLYRNLTA